MQPGMNTTIKSWCPTPGPQLAFMVTHDESLSISDYYTVVENGKAIYRPTCNYAYHPCEDAISSCFDLLGSGKEPSSEKWKILDQEITEGIDELGVLLYGHEKNAYWYGSRLDIHRTRKLIDCQNATGLQVSSAVIAGMVWAIENPEAGLIQAD